MTHPQTRDIALDPTRSGLLFIDVQNFSVKRDGGEFGEVSDADITGKYGYHNRVANAGWSGPQP